MPKASKLALLTLILSSAFAVHSAKAGDFYDKANTEYQLKLLSAPLAVEHVQQSSETKGKVAIAMVYQPDCKWCKKQGLWLAKANAQCSESIDIVLIGNNGSKRQLKRELKHFAGDIPAFLANRKLLTALGGIEASPTTLVFDSAGQLLAKRRGYVDNQQLSDVAHIVSQGACELH